MQILHCREQAGGQGGASEFVDAYNVAAQMKEKYPDYYKLLCEVNLDFYQIGHDMFGNFHKINTHRTFK